MSAPHTVPPRDRNPWPFRIGFTLFLVLLGGGFFVLMLIIAPALDALRDEDTVIYKCEAVLSGDTVVVIPVGRHTEDAQPITVQVEGILAPPDESGDQAAYAKRIRTTPDRISRLARSSRGALSVWILKRENLLLHYDPEKPVYDAAGHLVARVETSKVDVGKIQLRAGQALATETDHEMRPLYTGWEKQAREAGIGIWRTP